MLFRQITHDDLGCASYLIGDEHAGVAAVVDPRFQIDEYLELARYRGVTIEHVLETHNHADHVSGHGRLVAATGARIHVHRLAEPEYAHDPFDDGWELRLGALLVRALHTPGHRPEHTSFVLVDTERGEEPWAVLSGDSLFVGDVARTDLAVESAEGARQIFRSLHERLLTLPDETEVWPAHLGGSMCGGAGMNLKICSTIGFERRHNPTLAVTSEALFVERALERLGAQPPNFEKIVAINRGPLVTSGVETPALYSHQVELKRAEGALLVDVRTDLQFDDVHIEGSICIPSFSPGFGSKLAWLADHDREVVFIGRDDADGRRAAQLALSVGVRNVAGLLAGGMTNWRQEGNDVGHIERVAADALPARMAREPGLQLLDVRERDEWDAGHVAGSVWTAWHDIDSIPAGLDPDRPIAVACAAGKRSATAASLLKLNGAGEVIHVSDGGIPTLAEHGVELVVAPHDAPACESPAGAASEA
ncbi:MAG: hydroxyacylglutathione hydrolase [Solirubrobacteraceae bacterium]|nr:hydroxyacylglutathione hydrolase [Solirubrobacteraceae bacterium]